jgi:hypothetical protein
MSYGRRHQADEEGRLAGEQGMTERRRDLAPEPSAAWPVRSPPLAHLAVKNASTGSNGIAFCFTKTM